MSNQEKLLSILCEYACKSILVTSKELSEDMLLAEDETKELLHELIKEDLVVKAYRCTGSVGVKGQPFAIGVYCITLNAMETEEYNQAVEKYQADEDGINRLIESVTNSGLQKRSSPLKAIRRYCVDQCCLTYAEVRKCPDNNCPLHDYRMGHLPKEERQQEVSTNGNQ